MNVIFVKVFFILIKTTAKPIISFLTYYNKTVLKESKKPFHEFIREKFINVGQSHNYYYTKFNRKFLRLKTNDPIKLLSKDKAMDKGIEVVSEAILYFILITIPLYEYIKSLEYKKEQSIINSNRLLRIKSSLKDLDNSNKYVENVMFDEVRMKLEKFDKEISVENCKLLERKSKLL